MRVEVGRVTVPEYLSREEKAEVRHELINGEVVERASGSYDHGVIQTKLLCLLRDLSEECVVIGSLIKIQLDNGETYFYPDAMIACPPRVVNERMGAIDNPTVVFEILSPGTEARDTRRKLPKYKSVESIQEIVYIASDAIYADVYRRFGSRWEVITFMEGDTLKLESVGIEFALDELFVGLDLSISSPSGEADS